MSVMTFERGPDHQDVATARVTSVWAPRARSVELLVDGTRRALTPTPTGWHRDDRPLPPGTDYAFSLDGGPPRFDPRSRWQPEGITGPSRVLDDAALRWTDDDWHGVHLPSAVLYELHVGMFTPEGTFEA